MSIFCSKCFYVSLQVFWRTMNLFKPFNIFNSLLNVIIIIAKTNFFLLITIYLSHYVVNHFQWCLQCLHTSTHLKIRSGASNYHIWLLSIKLEGIMLPSLLLSNNSKMKSTYCPCYHCQTPNRNNLLFRCIPPSISSPSSFYKSTSHNRDIIQHLWRHHQYPNN